MLNQKLLLWTFCTDRGFVCEWLVGVCIGLAFGIFRQPAYTLKAGKFSDFCASNQ